MLLAFFNGAVDKNTKKLIYDHDDNDTDVRFDLRHVELSDRSNYSILLNICLIQPNFGGQVISHDLLANTSQNLWNSLNAVGQEPIDVLQFLFERCSDGDSYLDTYFFYDSVFHFNTNKKFSVQWCDSGDPAVC